jgi:hypothetical protein
LQLADEMNKTADLSGKSRKQQEAEIAAIQARADVQAATLAAMRTDPQFGTRMTEATASMSKFGPKIEELLAEEATLGGARSDDALNTKAMMGSAGAAIAEYGKAIKSGNAEEIAIAKERAERAIAAKLADQKFNETIAVTQGNVLNGGALVAGSYDTTKNIIAKQADVLAKTGKHIDEYEAIKLLEKEGALRTKGKTPEGKIDEGAVVGRTINQIDNLGKVVGGTMAQGFNKLNTELGQTISTHLPALNAKLKAMGSPEGFKSEVSSTTSGAINSVASKLGAKIVPKDDKTRELLNKGPTSIRKETAPANESGATTPAANAPESSSSSVMTELRDFFSQLNTKMDDLIRHSSSTADSAQKQVRATESLSGNRLG